MRDFPAGSGSGGAQAVTLRQGAQYSERRENAAVAGAASNPVLEEGRRLYHLKGPWDYFPRILDSLHEGLRLCDGRGAVLYQNAALQALLEGDPEQERLEEEIEVLVRSLFLVVRNRDAGLVRGEELDAEAELSLERLVRTEKGKYSLRGTYLGPSSRYVDPAVLVLLEPSAPELVSDEKLQEQFGLTTRQISVARMIAEGMANQQIAEALCISSHTVRHHVEQILLKLGLRSRTEVGPALLQG